MASGVAICLAETPFACGLAHARARNAKGPTFDSETFAWLARMFNADEMGG